MLSGSSVRGQSFRVLTTVGVFVLDCLEHGTGPIPAFGLGLHLPSHRGVISLTLASQISMFDTSMKCRYGEDSSVWF